MRLLLWVLVLITLSAGQEEGVQFDESFDPSTLKEPPLEWPVILHPGDKLPEEERPEAAEPVEEGFRIQVISTQDFQTVDSLMNGLTSIFHDEVYVTFDPPNYKVRVGNYRFRSEAEKTQSRLIKMGFQTAWVIRTRIQGPSRSATQ